MLWLLLSPLLWRRGCVSLLHLSMMKKIPKVHLEKLMIHVPGRNQPSMSRDFRGENPGWGKVYKISTTCHLPSAQLMLMLMARQTKQSLPCSLPLQDPSGGRNTHSKKRKERERDCCGRRRGGWSCSTSSCRFWAQQVWRREEALT